VARDRAVLAKALRDGPAAREVALLQLAPIGRMLDLPGAPT